MNSPKNQRPNAKVRRLSVHTKRILISSAIALNYSDNEIIEAIRSKEGQQSTLSRMIGEIRCANSKTR